MLVRISMLLIRVISSMFSRVFIILLWLFVMCVLFRIMVVIIFSLLFIRLKGLVRCVLEMCMMFVSLDRKLV